MMYKGTEEYLYFVYISKLKQLLISFESGNSRVIHAFFFIRNLAQGLAL